MKRWRRRLLIIALLLLTGAAVNVAVAWTIAALGPKPPVHVLFSFATGFDLYGSGEFEVPPLIVELGQQKGVRRRPAWHMGSPGSATSVICAGFGHWQSWGHSETTHAFGWPELALCYASRPTVEGGRSRSALRLPEILASCRLFAKTDGAVRAGIIAPGFLLNTLFYAAILALPLSFFPLRARLLARRGHCPKCNYDRAGIDGPCPECGAPSGVR